MRLSILICSLHNRLNYLTNLLALLRPQLTDDVEVLIEQDNGELTIGEKRTKLLNISKGQYVAFIDDDDEISRDYVSKIITATETNPDCCSLMGVYTINGHEPVLFEHSIKYKQWKTNHPNNPIRYERSPNHLNAIKREIAVKYDFIPVNNGEDRDWSVRIMPELKTESYVDGVIYHYKYRSNK